jgi:hypothetical protein
MQDPNEPIRDPNARGTDVLQKAPPATFTVQVIWGALLAGQLMYLMAAFQMTAKRAAGQNLSAVATDPGVLKLPFTILAVAVCAAAIFIPRILAKTNPKGVDTQNAPLTEVIPLFFTPFIVRIALFEAVTLFGFVLVIAGREPITTMLPFMAASVVGFILNFPNEVKIRGLLKPSGPTQI